MSKLPALSGRQLVKILRKVGFIPIRQKGSHIILAKSDPEGRRGIVVPNHKEIDRGTLAEIIRQTGLTREEFLNLLR